MAIIRRENGVRSNFSGEEDEERSLRDENTPEARDEEWTKKEDGMSESGSGDAGRISCDREAPILYWTTRYSIKNHLKNKTWSKERYWSCERRNAGTLQYGRELLLESYFLTTDRKESVGKDDISSQTGKAAIRRSWSDDCQWWSSDELDIVSESMQR